MCCCSRLAYLLLNFIEVLDICTCVRFANFILFIFSPPPKAETWLERIFPRRSKLEIYYITLKIVNVQIFQVEQKQMIGQNSSELEL